MMVIMSTDKTIAIALAALGHETRLAVFRLLVRAGEDGLNVGDIAARMGLAASTLSHHLGALVDAGLVIQERSGREVRNRVNFIAMRATLNYLSDECCQGFDAETGNAA